MKNWKQYCPLMKGICCNGFVKGMPQDSETGEQTKCAFFMTLKGLDPQDGKVIDDPGCSIFFLPIIAIEANQIGRQGAASTDKVASLVQDQHKTILSGMLNGVKNRIEDKLPKKEPKLVGKFEEGEAKNGNNTG